MNSLNHLAIIMDGNGRWAQNRNIKRTEGHKAGAKVVRDITIWAAKRHISYLSLFAFSTENWTRPKIEVEFLMRLLERYLESEITTYTKNNIRFVAIGDLDIFSKKLRDLIFYLQDISKNNTNLTQILALNYGGRDEIARTYLKIHRFINENTNKEEVARLINENLDTAEFPDIDLLIRTGGEMRISNFMLYQMAYAELFFSNTLFPDLKIDELEEITDKYQQRVRRFGGI